MYFPSEKLAHIRPYVPHLAVLAVAMVLGLGVGMFKATSSPPAVDIADRWPFPKWVPYRAGAKRDDLRRLAIWSQDPGRQQEVEAVKADSPPWRFIGTMQDGDTHVAVIELDQGKRIQRVASGEPLPNGALIREISVSELVYDESGEEKTLKLFDPALPVVTPSEPTVTRPARRVSRPARPASRPAPKAAAQAAPEPANRAPRTPPKPRPKGRR